MYKLLRLLVDAVVGEVYEVVSNLFGVVGVGLGGEPGAQLLPTMLIDNLGRACVFFQFINIVRIWSSN